MPFQKNLHPSKYIIYVPCRKRFIITHGSTGAVDLVQPEVVDYLRLGRNVNSGGSSLPNLPPETIAHLKDRGYLTTKTPEEEEAYLCQLGEILHRRHRTAGSTFFLCPTYKCQLRCPYCFELWMYKKGKDYMSRTMSPEVVDAAFDAIPLIQPDPKKVKEITLFGGEPLLGENIDIVAYILDQCHRAGYSQVWAITNGIELDKYLHLLGTELGKIRRLQITLDGPPEIHDKRRHWPNGEGTFKTIVANISKALETGAVVTVRTNVDQTNLEHIDELAKLYNEKGWSKKPNFGAYCQIVFYTKRKGADLAVSRVKLAEAIEGKKKEYPQLRFMHGSFAVRRAFGNLLEKGPLRAFHPAFCGTNNDMYIFDALGSIYVCTEALGETSACVGAYYPKFYLFDTILDRFRNRTIMNIPACRKCPWALLCGGGCMQHAKEAKGDYYNNFCAEYQALFVKLAPEVYEHWLRQKRGGEVEQYDLVKHPGLWSANDNLASNVCRRKARSDAQRGVRTVC